MVCKTGVDSKKVLLYFKKIFCFLFSTDWRGYIANQFIHSWITWLDEIRTEAHPFFFSFFFLYFDGAAPPRIFLCRCFAEKKPGVGGELQTRQEKRKESFSRKELAHACRVRFHMCTATLSRNRQKNWDGVRESV